MKASGDQLSVAHQSPRRIEQLEKYNKPNTIRTTIIASLFSMF